jgi:hypothetical protein
MREFRYVQDIDAWLEPMDYQGFWAAIAPYDLVLQPRAHCDQQIAEGLVDQACVLDGLKYMTRLELTARHDLKRRPVTPWLQLVE